MEHTDFPTIRLTGHSAIDYAELNDMTLDNLKDSRQLTIEEARAVAAQDPESIYIDAPTL